MADINNIRESLETMKRIQEQEKDILIKSLGEITAFNAKAKSIVDNHTLQGVEKDYIKEFIKNSDEIIAMWEQNLMDFSKAIAR